MKCLVIFIFVFLAFQSGTAQIHGYMHIVINGHVHFIVTDSVGHKSGFDPRTMIKYNEIQNAGYGTICCGSIDSTEPQDEGWEFMFLRPIDSLYKNKYDLEVVGRGQETYSGVIILEQTSSGEGYVFKISDVIDSTQSVFYYISYSTDSLISPTVTKIVNAPLLIQDLNNCYSLRLLKNPSLYYNLASAANQTDSLLRMNDTTTARYQLLQFDILIDKASSDTSKIDSFGYKILKEDANTLFSSLPPNIIPSTPVPQYTLTVTDSGNGFITKNPDLSSYDSASSVQMTATPSSGYSFTAWSGDASGSTNPLSLVMNGNKNVIAAFSQTNFIITASAGANGAISPTGAVNVSYGGNQVFTFTPNTGYYVDSLIVDGTKQTSASSYTFNSVSTNHTIRVTFSNQYTLTILISGGGTVTISPNNSSYSYGTSVRMTAHNTSGGQSMIKPNNPEPKSWRFDHWELDASGSTNPKDITINANKTVRAVFVAVY